MLLKNAAWAEAMDNSFYGDAGAWNVPDDDENNVSVFDELAVSVPNKPRYNSSRVTPA